MDVLKPKRSSNDWYYRTVCPYCHAVDDSRVLRSLGNLARILFNVAICFAVGWIPAPLERVCRVCGERFQRRTKGPPDA